MARPKTVVELFPALQEVVDALKVKYPIALEDVDPTRILYLQTNGKGKRGKVVAIEPIRVPHPSVTPFRFALKAFREFGEIDEARQVLHVLRELLRIQDFEECKLGPYLLQDFPEIVEKYGTTWTDREDIESPLQEDKEEELRESPLPPREGRDGLVERFDSPEDDDVDLEI